MADDTGDERRLEPEATAAPNRDWRDAPPIIEGEAPTRDDASTSVGDERSQAQERTPSQEAEPQQTASPIPDRQARRIAPLAAAALGAAIGAVVAGAIVWFERSTDEAGLPERLASFQTPIDDLAKRVAALEGEAQGVKAFADDVKKSQNDIEAARADAAKALAVANDTASALDQRKDAAPAAEPRLDTSAIEARLTKLESANSSQGPSGADLAPTQERLAKIEAALAAPKNETRVAPEESGLRPSDETALAVAAESVADRLARGAPYITEERALERLGADPAKIAALKPFAEKGAPTAAALAGDFAKTAPSALKAAAPAESGGVMDRLMRNMSKVVKVTPAGETQGDDPAALISQIGATLDRGDIAAAMSLWARLPEPARRALQGWASGAEARLAADNAAQGILNDAMAKLAAGDKP